MSDAILPVACPQCGESQNRAPGGFDPDREPFSPVYCMVCGHAFTADEYRGGLVQAIREVRERRKSRSRPAN